MKAARIHEFGSSKKIHIENIPIPRIKKNEALIRVRAAGVNPVDWHIREHQYNPPGTQRLPQTLGQDFSGVIEKMGSGLKSSEFKVGDEVLGEVWGSFAEYVVAPIKSLVRKPKGMDFITAASIPLAGLTAWQVVVDTAKAKPGMRFLIHGASGPVGTFAVQFAKLKGAEVAATASRSNFRFLKSIGVDQLIDYRSERFEYEVSDIDVVIEHLGGDTQLRSFGVMKKGGTLINLVGEVDKRAAKKAGVRAIDFGMGYDVEELKKIVDLVAKGKIKTHVTQILPLRQVRKALDLNQQGKSHGKIVLKVA